MRFFVCRKFQIATFSVFMIFAAVIAFSIIFDYSWQINLGLLAVLLVGYIAFTIIYNQIALKKLKMKLYKNCDPLAYADDCKYCMQYEKDLIQSFLFTVDLTESYIEMGEYAKALDIADYYTPGYSMPYFKFIYYCNITRALLYLDREEEADEYYARMHQQYTEIKSKGDRARADNYAMILEVEYALKKGDADLAKTNIDRLERCEKPNLYMLIHLELAKAEYCILCNDKANVKRHLNYVLLNGNKLYAVTLAKNYLEQL